MEKYYERTVRYYDRSAQEFFDNTFDCDVNELRNYFLQHVPKGGDILDFGCGPGRDTKFFKEKGYNVDAIDGSEQFCKMALEYSGIKAQCILFQDYEPVKQYDGIWASASLLHLDDSDLKMVIERLIDGLEDGGCLYMSFKHGNFCGERHGRFFNDQTEKSVEKLISDMPDLKIIKIVVDEDSRPNWTSRKWLNVFLRKGA